MNEDDIEHWLSGLTAPSVAILSRHFPRWRHYLAEQGVTDIPTPLSADPVEADATNVLCMLVRQASVMRDP